MGRAFTYEEISAILDEALNDVICKVDGEETASNFADGCWNRGAKSMLNHVLLLMLKKEREG